MMVTADLIAHHIRKSPHHPGPGDVIVDEGSISVWILVEAYRASGNDANYVARAWDISREAVDAAIAYYAAHTASVDARIEAQRASFD